MLEFCVFTYGLMSMFIIRAARQNERLARPNPAMVTVVGWGLFSMSTTLALLGGAMVVISLIF